MDSRLIVQEGVHQLDITPVGCHIRNIDVQSATDALVEDIDEINQLTGDASEVLASSVVDGSRDLFRRLGRPDQEPAGEQLVKLIEARGFNRNNNVVDAYNVVGARSGAILGMHDASEIDGPITIRRTDGGETMLPIFHEEPETAAEDDLIWESGEDILALLGPVSRDADTFKITETTEEVLLIVPGNPNTSEPYGRKLCQRTFELIKRTCPDAEMEFLNVQRDSVAMGSHTATPADD